MNRTDEALEARTAQDVDLPLPQPEAEPAPATPPPATLPPAGSRRTGSVRRWRARLLVLLMLAGAVAGGVQLVQSRTHAAELLDIGTVTLTADPIPVQSDRIGLVRSVAVQARQRVAAGQELGRMTSLTSTGSGRTVRSTVVLRAPVAGIVSDDPVPVGSALQPGDAFAELYEPSRLTLIGNVALADLPRLKPDMQVTLTGADLPAPIEAVVGQVVPRVGGDQADVRPDHIAVELLPKDPRLLSQLVPGLRFEGTVDTGTGRPGEQPSVYIGP
jgi:multidrug efflux pump subunit AcrA (membrane-fusion protein)